MPDEARHVGLARPMLGAPLSGICPSIVHASGAGPTCWGFVQQVPDIGPCRLAIRRVGLRVGEGTVLGRPHEPRDIMKDATPRASVSSAVVAAPRRPPKGQHHHLEASYSKSEICSKRGLDVADHSHKAHQKIGPAGPDLSLCLMNVTNLI
jgi:hypothetical protein